MKLLFFALFCLGTFSGAALEINSDFVIVSSRTAIAPEKKSAELLCRYLNRVFGKKLLILT